MCCPRSSSAAASITSSSPKCASITVSTDSARSKRQTERRLLRVAFHICAIAATHFAIRWHCGGVGGDAKLSLLVMKQKPANSRAFFAIYLAIAISYVGVGLVAPLIALVLGAHGENNFVIGLIGTTMFTAFTLASFPVGAAT